MEQVTVKAASNIAICKYWGKSGPLNSPATPSISLALDKLATTTTVSRIGGPTDRIRIGGQRSQRQTERVQAYLDWWRELGLVQGRFRVESANSFPTSAGLASSASGFAALAGALAQFAQRPVGTPKLSRLARAGSGSAARSVTGGLSALPTGTDPAARLIASPGEIPWAMAIAVTNRSAKPVGSREGMLHCANTSPYYREWVRQSGRDYRAQLRAVACWDLELAGAVMEANTQAMHGCMLAARPPLRYWSRATVGVMELVGKWRGAGLPTYATTDAGPNVAVLCHASDLQAISRKLRPCPGVETVIACHPAPGIQVVDAR